MSSTQQLLLGEGAGGSGPANYIEDVFSTYLYTGNSSTQTITNGIDLAGKGGLVWRQGRSAATGGMLIDTSRGIGSYLISYSTAAAQTGSNWIDSFNSNGFTMNSSSFNGGATYASWTFRKQPKFFDVVTYTGNGGVQNIAHNLGSTPGMIIVKGINYVENWIVYHRSLGETKYIQLNSTGAAGTYSAAWNDTAPTSTQFTVGSFNAVNESGYNYVAYVFAHNAGGFGLTGTDNVISCGSFTTDGSGYGSVTLGYEPQWILMKDTQGSASYDNWYIIDNMRGFLANGNANELYANKSDAENANVQRAAPTATGFIPQGLNASRTYIYIAIRRGPMAVPTSGTSVFAPFYASYSEGAAITTNFPIDLSMWKGDVTYNWSWQDRLRGTPTSTGSGGPALASNSTAAETTSYTGVGITKLDSNIGGSVSYQADSGRSNAAAYFMLRRAPSFFDEVCYTGNGSTQTITHNLTVVPELIIAKNRGQAGNNWPVLFNFASTTMNYGFLNLTNSCPNDTYANVGVFSAAPTSTSMFLTNSSSMNASGYGIVAYLFATCAGVSKVGSYTGNGSTQQIDCGFTGGARFVMIKQTSGSGGDWYVYSSALGIVAGSDRTVLFNSSNASSAYGDTLDALSSGFELGPDSSSFGSNTSGATYIFLAIA